MYAKLENGRLMPAPKMLTVGENHVWNAPAAQYAALGWKLVQFTDAPGEAEPGYGWESAWEEGEDAVVQIWRQVALPPEEPDAGEILDILLGGEGE